MSIKKDSLIDVCKEYCTGCGLCGSVLGKKFNEDDKKYLYPDLNSDDYDFCKTVCPAAGNYVNNYSDGSIWGNVLQSRLGWSVNDSVRFKASSGGVITSLCCYLIENKIVDGIIQTKKDDLDPRKTVTKVCTTREDVLECCGSRYTTSSPLSEIKSHISENKKYAFVGKPCDVSALRMLKNSNIEKWTEQIIYMFSFFCAGQPSLAANNKLLSELGCKSVDECLELSYRGNGWPGKATVTLKNGKSSSMDYEKSWMTILGRDVRKCCRFCADGTGETADVSCGDAWFLNAEEKPDFEERSGRNVIFTRTKDGEELLKQAIKANVIEVEDFDIEKDKLRKIQPYHYNRKASLSSLKVALTLCRRNFPLYGKNKMNEFSKDFPIKSKVYRCVGTIKRVWSKVI